jgi:tellurite resistance protein TehA-like permease
VKIHNNSFIGAASYNIFVGIAVAFIFGAAFFFDLFWPERHECKHVRISWKISAVVVTIMMLSSALTLTVCDLILLLGGVGWGYKCVCVCVLIVCFAGCSASEPSTTQR